MRALIVAAFAFGIGAVAEAQTPDARVEEFRNICVTPASFEGYVAAAEQRGWVRVDPAQSRVSALVGVGQSAMTDGEFQVFVRELDGVALDVMLTRIRVPQGLVHGCGLFHAGAQSGLEPAQFAGSWLQGAPVLEEQFGSRVYRWSRPAGLPNIFVLKLSHIPSESEIGRGGIFSGITMSVDRIEQ